MLTFTCGILTFTEGISPFKLVEISELVGQKALIDSNQQSTLESTVYLIKQSYQISSTQLSLAPWSVFSILTVLGISLLLLGFQKWSKISWPILLAGIIIWYAIQIYTSYGISKVDFLLYFGGQFTFLSIVSIFYITIIQSNAIPGIILQVGLANEPQESSKRWGFLGFFLGVNLIICLGNLLWNWDYKYAIPSVCFWLISLSIHLFNQFKKSNGFPFLHVGIALISLAGLSHLLISSNDAAIRGIEIWNIMCQTIMFILYPLFIVSNFKPLLSKNLPIHKVVDKPYVFPLTAIYAGVLMVGASWVFALNSGVYHQMVAGKYNAEGDLAQGLKDSFLAEVYYKKAMLHSRLNTKSNLSLAGLAKNQNDLEQEAFYLATALVKKPNALATIGLSTIYRQADRVFESLFELQKGFEKMPGSAPVATQLAYVFEQLNQKDSAQYYFQKAYSIDKNELTTANLAYSKVKYQHSNPTFEWENNLQNRGYQANLYALNLLNQKKTNVEPIPSDLKISADLRDLAMVFNAGMLLKNRQPTLPLEEWAKNEKITLLFPEITIASAMQMYHHGHPLQAMEKMALSISTDTSQQTAGMSAILNFWRQDQLMPIGKLTIHNRSQAEHAMTKHPFQVDVLQRSIPYLDPKKAYQAALSALQWNEKEGIYYAIYAFQALKIGEIDYAKVAMNKLNQLDPRIFSVTIQGFEKELLLAEQKRQF